MKKYERLGTKAFEAKENAKYTAKHPLAAVKANVAGAKKSAESFKQAYQEHKDNGGKSWGGIKAGLKAGSADGMKAARTTFKEKTKASRRGLTGRVMAERANASVNAERMKNAKEANAVRGIDTVEDMKKAIAGEINVSAPELKNIYLALAEKGQLDDKAMADAGSAVMVNDSVSADAFKASMKKKQIHLAYDFNDDKERAQFDRDVKSGDVDLTKQDESAYRDQKFMGAAYQALGAKAFGDQMKKVADRSEDHKEAVSRTVTNETFVPNILEVLKKNKATADADVAAKTAAHNQLLADNAPQPKIDEAAEALAKATREQSVADKELKKAPDTLPKTIAKVSGNLEVAFAQRFQDTDPTKPNHISTAPPNTRVGDTVKDPAGNFDVDHDKLKAYIGSLTAKEMAGLKIEDVGARPGVDDDAPSKTRGDIAEKVTVGQLSGMAKSSEPGALENLTKVLQEMGKLARGGDAEAQRKISEILINKDEIKDQMSADLMRYLQGAVPAPGPAPRPRRPRGGGGAPGPAPVPPGPAPVPPGPAPVPPGGGGGGGRQRRP